MKNNNNLFVLALVLLFSLFSNAAISEETAEVPINFKWDVSDSNAISGMKISNLQFSSCSGNNYNYGGDQYNPNNNDKFIFYINGPFPEDPRTSCNIGDNNVYFEITNMDISFTYNGQSYTCNIAQGVGTSYDHIHRVYDKLQGADSGNWWACDSKNLFKYKVNAGQDNGLVWNMSPGSIEIKPVS